MKRKNKRMIISLLIFSVVLVAGCTNTTQPSVNNEVTVPKGNGFDMISTGSTDMGDVLIELMPHEVSEGKLRVDIYVNTHSVDLSQFDLTEITMLEYDGKMVKPIQAPGLRGHHASGTLVFEVGEYIEEFVIKINGIPQIQERVFEWGT